MIFMKNDSVSHPAHYCDGNIEVIDYIEDKGFGYHLGNAIKYLKNCGFRVVAATEKAKYTYTKANLTDPVCIVMGAEDKGIPNEHLALCDEWISIPQFGHIQSLNVSVAAGIMMYEGVRQRLK